MYPKRYQIYDLVICSWLEIISKFSCYHIKPIGIQTAWDRLSWTVSWLRLVILQTREITALWVSVHMLPNWLNLDFRRRMAKGLISMYIGYWNSLILTNQVHFKTIHWNGTGVSKDEGVDRHHLISTSYTHSVWFLTVLLVKNYQEPIWI